MNSFAEFLKKARRQAGLSQKQVADKMDVSVISVQNWESGKNKVNPSKLSRLAWIYNIPKETILAEMMRVEEESRVDCWPDFLFDEATNRIVRNLHLNLKQQDLFGLLYLYHAQYLENEYMTWETLDKDLKVIPYEFIRETGSIQFINLAEGLRDVLQYVRTDFLLKVLRANPEEEFDLCTLDKIMICEFIDNGYKKYSDLMVDDFDRKWGDVMDQALHFSINMRKAGLILSVLENGPVPITDGRHSDPMREDVPKIIREEFCMPDERHSAVFNREGIQLITDFHTISGNTSEGTWILEMNEKGCSLLQWFG